MNVYTLPRTPGAGETTEWTAFCHSKEPFLVIDHAKFRHAGRSGCVERKRQFSVTKYVRASWGGFHSYTSWFSTLAKAQTFAAKQQA